MWWFCNLSVLCVYKNLCCRKLCGWELCCNTASTFLISKGLKETRVTEFRADKINTVLVLPDELFMLSKHREHKWLPTADTHASVYIKVL